MCWERGQLKQTGGERAHSCYFYHQTSQPGIFQIGGRKGLEEIVSFSSEENKIKILYI